MCQLTELSKNMTSQASVVWTLFVCLFWSHSILILFYTRVQSKSPTHAALRPLDSKTKSYHQLPSSVCHFMTGRTSSAKCSPKSFSRPKWASENCTTVKPMYIVQPTNHRRVKLPLYCSGGVMERIYSPSASLHSPTHTYLSRCDYLGLSGRWKVRKWMKGGQLPCAARPPTP